MLLDSTTNRYNIPPLHDLGVIVWLQGVTPTAGWTAVTSGGSPGGEQGERGLTQLKTTLAVCCTANYSSADAEMGIESNKNPLPEANCNYICRGCVGAYIDLRCQKFISAPLLNPPASFSPAMTVETMQQVVVAPLSVCLHLLFPGDF